MNAKHPGFRWMANVRGVTAMAGLALATMVLTGCSTTRIVDSEVRSFAGAAPVAAGASFKFERLLSQTAPAQEPLEAAAAQVLTGKGLQRNDAQARYSVQLRLEADDILSDSQRRWVGSPFPDRVLLGPHGTLWREVRRPMLDPTWHRLILSVVVRDLQAGTVAFESRALHESPWTDTLNLIAPVMQAAFNDFPQGQAEAKKLSVELPPKDAR